jgi:hypothetical protein
MGRLSVSRAWEEAKVVIAHDGRLFTSVALGLIALPTAITTVITPNGMSETSAMSIDIVVLIASLVAVAGQLALIRLATGPSVTVGGAIAHGLRRMPIYFLAVILICIGLLLIAVPIALVLAAMGVEIEDASKSISGPLLVGSIFYLVVILYIAVRMLMAAPAASAEPIGPIKVVRRSWQISAGAFWPLAGFLVIFFVGAIILLMAVQSIVGALATLAFGPLQPMSGSALVVALAQALVNAAVSTLFAVMVARIYLQLAGSGGAQASVPSSGI